MQNWTLIMKFNWIFSKLDLYIYIYILHLEAHFGKVCTAVFI